MTEMASPSIPETSAAAEGPEIVKEQDIEPTEDEKTKLYEDVLKAYHAAIVRHNRCIERINQTNERVDDLVIAISHHRSVIGSIAGNLKSLINEAYTFTTSSRAEPEQDGAWPVAHFEFFRLERETARLLEMKRKRCRLADALKRLVRRFASTQEIMEYTKMMADECRKTMDQA